MSQTVKDAIWFCGGLQDGFCIGIVQVIVDPPKEIKYYIGTGYGINEQMDAEHIAKWGMPFDKAAADVLFGVR